MFSVGCRSHYFCSPAGARAETIRGVEFRGLHLLAEETVRFYLGLVDGQELDEGALNRSIEELWRRNLVDDLKIEKVAGRGRRQADRHA